MRLSFRIAVAFVSVASASAVAATFCAAESPTIAGFLGQILLSVALVCGGGVAIWGAAVRRGESNALWSFLLVCGSMAILAPLAMESCDHPDRANVALLLAAMSPALWCGGFTSMTAAAVSTLVACMLSPAAAIWPAALLVGGMRQRGRFSWAVIVAAVFGLTAGMHFDLWPHAVVLPSLHRDLVMLLPVILLGLAGMPEVSAAASSDERQQYDWAVAGLAGIGLAIFGLPLDPRILSLPFWWLAPTGLRRLQSLVRSDSDENMTSRPVGVLSCAAAAILLWPAILHWRDALFLLMYVLDRFRG